MIVSLNFELKLNWGILLWIPWSCYYW